MATLDDLRGPAAAAHGRELGETLSPPPARDGHSIKYCRRLLADMLRPPAHPPRQCRRASRQHPTCLSFFRGTVRLVHLPPPPNDIERPFSSCAHHGCFAVRFLASHANVPKQLRML